jgi:hypothetical protein
MERSGRTGSVRAKGYSHAPKRAARQAAASSREEEIQLLLVLRPSLSSLSGKVQRPERGPISGAYQTRNKADAVNRPCWSQGPLLTRETPKPGLIQRCFREHLSKRVSIRHTLLHRVLAHFDGVQAKEVASFCCPRQSFGSKAKPFYRDETVDPKSLRYPFGID